MAHLHKCLHSFSLIKAVLTTAGLYRLCLTEGSLTVLLVLLHHLDTSYTFIIFIGSESFMTSHNSSIVTEV